MPIYEYRCNACNHSMEAIQKLSDSPLELCPACGEKALSKQVTAAGFRLKGGGWYETDFKGDSGKKKNLAGDAKPEASAKADAPAKTDAPVTTETKSSSVTSAA